MNTGQPVIRSVRVLAINGQRVEPDESDASQTPILADLQRMEQRMLEHIDARLDRLERAIIEHIEALPPTGGGTQYCAAAERFDASRR